MAGVVSVSKHAPNNLVPAMLIGRYPGRPEARFCSIRLTNVEVLSPGDGKKMRMGDVHIENLPLLEQEGTFDIPGAIIETNGCIRVRTPENFQPQMVT